jgi:multiple sugar transport system ATP-binding protein
VPCGTPGSIKASVDVSELMGSEVHLHVLVEETDVVIKAPTTDLNEVCNLGTDKYIYFTVTPSLMHLFDDETEQALLR